MTVGIVCKPNQISVKCIKHGILACVGWNNEHATRHLRMLKRSAQGTIPADSVEFQDIMERIARLADQKGLDVIRAEIVAEGLIAA